MNSMNIRINPNAGIPIYQQIVGQVKMLVASGRLAPGDLAPPIRALAERLLVNPNTVARAYRELEAAGIFTSRVGSGTVVADCVSPLARRERLRLLQEQIDTLLAEARHLNFPLEEVLEAIQLRSEELRNQDEGA